VPSRQGGRSLTAAPSATPTRPASIRGLLHKPGRRAVRSCPRYGAAAEAPIARAGSASAGPPTLQRRDGRRVPDAPRRIPGGRTDVKVPPSRSLPEHDMDGAVVSRRGGRRFGTGSASAPAAPPRKKERQRLGRVCHATSLPTLATRGQCRSCGAPGRVPESRNLRRGPGSRGGRSMRRSPPGNRPFGWLVSDSGEALAVELGEGDAVGGVGDDEVEHGPDEREAAGLAGNRLITLVRRLTSPSDRSSRFVERQRRRCRGG
jgi:hypothetical protein